MQVKNLYNNMPPLGNIEPKRVRMKAFDEFIKMTNGGLVERQVPGAPPIPNRVQLQGRGVTVDDNDLEESKRIIFSELSNRGSEEERKQEARHIINTAINRVPQKKRDLINVLRENNQYQGYGTKQYNLAAGAPEKLDVLAAGKMKLIQSIIDEMKTGNFPDTTKGAAFYIHEPDGRLKLQHKPLFK